MAIDIYTQTLRLPEHFLTLKNSKDKLAVGGKLLVVPVQKVEIHYY